LAARDGVDLRTHLQVLGNDMSVPEQALRIGKRRGVSHHTAK